MGGIHTDQGEVNSPPGISNGSPHAIPSAADSWGDQEAPLLALLDGEGAVISLSSGMAMALGLAATEAIGRPLPDLLDGDAREELRARLEELRAAPSAPAVRRPGHGSVLMGGIRFNLVRMEGASPGVMVLGSSASLASSSAFTSYEVAEQLFSWPDLLAIALDREGRVITFSHSAEVLTGHRQEDAIGREMVELLDEDDTSKELYKVELGRVLGGETVTGEVRIRGTGGSSLRLNWRMQPLRDPQGRVIGVMGFGHAAHALKPPGPPEGVGESCWEVMAETSTNILESEELAEALEKGLEKLIESVGVDFAVFRLLGRENKPRMVCAGLDFRRSRMLLESHLVGEGPLYRGVQSGASYLSLDAQTDPRIVLEDKEIRSFICLPIRFRGEVYGCGAFGSLSPGTNLQSKQPVLQVVCNQVAVSTRKLRLKDELTLKNQELESLFETSTAVSSDLDMQKVLGTILSRAADLVNADSVYLFQMDKNTALLHLISCISPYGDLVDGLTLRTGEGVTGLVAQTREGMLVERADKDNRSVHVPGTPDDPSSLISVPLKMGDELLGVVTLERVPGLPFSENEFRLIQLFSFQASTAIHNALMFKRLNEHASAQQMYNILLTHDVANYNVPIHGYLEMLAKDPKLDERQRRFVKSSLAQSENISSLIADVRKLSLLRTMESVRSFEPIDLPKVITEVLEDIRQNTLYEDTDVHFHPIAGQVLVNGDTFVKDVVYNLVSNACKHAGEAPIDVVLRPHEEGGGQFWRMDVKDQGGGISEDRKAFLFRRFESVDANSASEGHGIGLSVVSALCERFGGRVWVEDRVELDGIKGSIFSVTFPMVKV